MREERQKALSHVPFFVTPWAIAYQAPPFMGFSRQEYWSGLPFPSPEDLPDQGIKPRFPALQAEFYHLRVAQTAKNLPAVQETQVQSLGWKGPLEKSMATHSSILAWRIP